MNASDIIRAVLLLALFGFIILMAMRVVGTFGAKAAAAI